MVKVVYNVKLLQTNGLTLSERGDIMSPPI